MMPSTYLSIFLLLAALLASGERLRGISDIIKPEYVERMSGPQLRCPVCQKEMYDGVPEFVLADSVRNSLGPFTNKDMVISSECLRHVHLKCAIETGCDPCAPPEWNGPGVYDRVVPLKDLVKLVENEKKKMIIQAADIKSRSEDIVSRSVTQILACGELLRQIDRVYKKSLPREPKASFCHIYGVEGATEVLAGLFAFGMRVKDHARGLVLELKCEKASAKRYTTKVLEQRLKGLSLTEQSRSMDTMEATYELERIMADQATMIRIRAQAMQLDNLLDIAISRLKKISSYPSQTTALTTQRGLCLELIYLTGQSSSVVSEYLEGSSTREARDYEKRCTDLERIVKRLPKEKDPILFVSTLALQYFVLFI